MAYNFLPCDRNQAYLLPPSLTDWLPPDHLAWFVLDAVEQIKAGILTGQQCRTADFADNLIGEHIEVYLEHLQHKTIRGKRVSSGHCDNVRRQLMTLLNDCAFRRLQDITRDAMQTWMNAAEQAGKGARTRNTYRAAIIAFCNWCVQTDRLSVNPLARLGSADEHRDRRKTRRALTVQELGRLFTAARLRPLAEYGRVTLRLPKAQRQGRRTWQKEPLRFEQLERAARCARMRLKDKPALIVELEWTGKERALMYKTLAMTGLRRGELASITLAQVWLDVPQPYLELKAKDEKNGRGAHIPLRQDLANEIGQFIADKRKRRQGGDYTMPLFDMPDSLIGIFDRDLAAAGIDKQDPRGRTLDVHALRHNAENLIMPSF